MDPGFGEEIGRRMVQALLVGAVIVAGVAGLIGYIIAWVTVR
jgi:phage shock protein PspC (stress-responsive transcriptional regulator)